MCCNSMDLAKNSRNGYIQIILRNFENCVSYNGHISSFFKLSKVIRQGCPVSALLFLLIGDVIAITLRHSEELVGIIS